MENFVDNYIDSAGKGCGIIRSHSHLSSDYLRLHKMSVNSHCPICKVKTGNLDSLRKHLVEQHSISRRQAKFFTAKLVEWSRKREELTSMLKQMSSRKGFDLELN